MHSIVPSQVDSEGARCGRCVGIQDRRHGEAAEGEPLVGQVATPQRHRPIAVAFKARAQVEQRMRLLPEQFGVGSVHVVCEIGRASCRERVCQYVSISVVSVTLTKKITTKKKSYLFIYSHS